MRDFAMLENSRGGNLTASSFSASACQQIHSELLESVNQIYQDMKRKPLLKRNAISTSSISHTKTRAPGLSSLAKSKSIELKSSSSQQRKATIMAELETVKKSSRKASRSRSNADEKTRIKIVGENGVKEQW